MLVYSEISLCTHVFSNGTIPREHIPNRDVSVRHCATWLLYVIHLARLTSPLPTRLSFLFLVGCARMRVQRVLGSYPSVGRITKDVVFRSGRTLAMHLLHNQRTSPTSSLIYKPMGSVSPALPTDQSYGGGAPVF